MHNASAYSLTERRKFLSKKIFLFIIPLLFFSLVSCYPNEDEDNNTSFETASTISSQISAQVQFSETEEIFISEKIIYNNNQRELLPDIYLYSPPGAFFSEQSTVQNLFIDVKNCHFTYENTKNLVRIVPEAPLDLNEEIEIVLQYRLIPPNDQSNFGVVNKEYNLAHLFFSPAYYKDSWIINPSSEIGETFVLEPSSYNVKIIAPPQYQIAAPGTRFIEEDGITFYSDFARDFAVYISPHHLEKTVLYEGISLHFYYTNNHVLYLDNWIQSVKNILSFYKDNFGPLATTNLNLVFTENCLRDGGQEYSDLMFFYFNSLLDSPYESVSQEINAVLAHELAHQWFYHLLGNNQGMEPFLDEGLATWAEAMYLREQNCFDVNILEAVHQSVISRETEETSILRQNIYDFTNSGSYTFDIYYGGASLLYQMEKLLGRESFSKFLYDYISCFRLDFVTIEDFLSYWNNVAGDSISTLFSLYLGDGKG